MEVNVTVLLGENPNEGVKFEPTVYHPR
jgi:hypothetical protein